MGSRIATRLARRIRSSNLGEQLTVTRIQVGEGSRNSFGEFVPGQNIETDINAVVVPLSGAEVLSLEEGLRSENLRRFFTVEEISSVREGAPNIDPSMSDMIRFDGSLWRVEVAKDWGGYHETIVAEVRDAA